MIHKVISLLIFITKSIKSRFIDKGLLFKIKHNYLGYDIDISLKKTYIKIRKNLLSNKNYITVTDYGEGFILFHDNRRQISRIARYSGIGKKRGKILIRLIDFIKPKNILEIGTSVGMGTSCLSLGNPNSRIITLEGCPETAQVAKNLFSEFNFDNIIIKIGRFEDTLIDVVQKQKFDFIYFDGNHSEDSTIKYFNLCLSTIQTGTIFLFDDIHWNRGMENAWKYIKKHNLVQHTIDTYRWGIVFFERINIGQTNTEKHQYIWL